MINYDLKKIRAMAFDVDGVLSAALVGLLEAASQPLRTANKIQMLYPKNHPKQLYKVID